MIPKFLLTAAALLALALPAGANPLAKDVFGAARTATAGPAHAVGGYSRGCAAGLVAMPESGPTWQAMRLSRNRYWGHPELIGFVMGLSQAATQVGWKGLYVGDISQPRGGPTQTGHASHQIGLDVDIWMLPPRSLSLSQQERENISSVSIVNSKGTQLSGNWTPSHGALIRAAAMDPRVDRIFVDPMAKVALCQNATRADRGWLQKIRPLNGHNYHMHVRLKCPAGSSLCEPQHPSVAQLSEGGDGCDQAAAWIRERMNPTAKPTPPDPDYRHPRTFRMSELPAQCQNVAAAQ